MRLALSLAAANTAVVACAVLVAAGVGPGSPSAPVTFGTAVPQPAGPSTSDAASSDTDTLTRPPASVPETPPATPPPTPPPPAAESPAAAPVAPAPREVITTGWRPYATVGPVALHFPGDVVEVVGLHQSGHDGALPQDPAADAGRIGRLETRGRGTHVQGAADIVMEPSGQVRSPVTGTVVRAGSYALYCDHTDHFLVIEPDARPGWEVKVLHFEGLAVNAGDRVEAGVTPVGSRARLLPFASQVDKYTAAPHWPHVHIEVVDPSIPDRSSGGGCD